MALGLSKDEQTELGIKDFVLQRIHPNAKKLKMTGKDLLIPWNENMSCLTRAMFNPNEVKTKHLFAIEVLEEVEFIMSNHPCKYKDKMMLQREVGSIGSILTCGLAKTRMIVNTRKLKEKPEFLKNRWFTKKKINLRSNKSVIQTSVQQKEIKLALFKVYVDDEFVLASRIGPGWR